MTTAISEINLFAELERQMPLSICTCGKRMQLLQRQEGNSIVLKRYPACRNCASEEKTSAEGWETPTHHPMMPPIFRDTDVEKLHPRMKDALEWSPTFSKSGMLLHGTTGIGKSRAAWEWINRAWLKGVKKDLHLPFLFLSMSDLEEKIQESFSEKSHSDTLRRLYEEPILILDDFGKERLTPRMATDLFAIIDKRTLKSKVTIITTNFNSKGLIDRFAPQDKETGIALVRRMRDYYTAYGMKEISS